MRMLGPEVKANSSSLQHMSAAAAPKATRQTLFDFDIDEIVPSIASPVEFTAQLLLPRVFLALLYVFATNKSKQSNWVVTKKEIQISARIDQYCYLTSTVRGTDMLGWVSNSHGFESYKITVNAFDLYRQLSPFVKKSPSRIELSVSPQDDGMKFACFGQEGHSNGYTWARRAFTFDFDQLGIEQKNSPLFYTKFVPICSTALSSALSAVSSAAKFLLTINDSGITCKTADAMACVPFKLACPGVTERTQEYSKQSFATLSRIVRLCRRMYVGIPENDSGTPLFFSCAVSPCKNLLSSSNVESRVYVYIESTGPDWPSSA